MRQRFKARELWLFAPFLLIGVAALFYRRWEQVNPPEKRGMYVSKIERTPATGRDEAMDVSHYVTVTLSHSWPKPRWWGEIDETPLSLDPMNEKRPPTVYYTPKTNIKWAAGGIITALRPDKTVFVDAISTGYPRIVQFDGQNYKIKHPFNLRGVSPKLGKVTFRGLYQFKNGDLVRAQKVVRAAGEKFPPVDKNPGVKLVSIEATPWKNNPMGAVSNLSKTSDLTAIKIIVEPILPLASKTKKPELNCTITDMNDETTGVSGYTTYGTGFPEEPKISLKPGQIGKVFNLSIDAQDKTKGRITVKGNVYLGDRWPIPFEIKLPPRPAATAPAK